MSELNKLTALSEIVGYADNIADELTAWLKGSNNTERYAYTHAKLMKYNEFLTVADVIEQLFGENEKLEDNLTNITNNIEDINEIISGNIEEGVNKDFNKVKDELITKINKIKEDFDKLLEDFKSELEEIKDNVINDYELYNNIVEKYNTTKYASNRQLIREADNIFRFNQNYGDNNNGLSFINPYSYPECDRLGCNLEMITYNQIEEILKPFDMKICYPFNNSSFSFSKSNKRVSFTNLINNSFFRNAMLISIPILPNTFDEILKENQNLIFSVDSNTSATSFNAEGKYVNNITAFNIRFGFAGYAFSKDTNEYSKSITLSSFSKNYFDLSTVSNLDNDDNRHTVYFSLSKDIIKELKETIKITCKEENINLGYYIINIKFELPSSIETQNKTFAFSNPKLSYGNIITDYCLSDNEGNNQSNLLINEYTEKINKEIEEVENLNNRIKNTEKLIVNETFEIGLENDPSSIVAIVHADGSMRIRGNGRTRDLFTLNQISQELYDENPLFKEMSFTVGQNYYKSIFPDRIKNFVTSIEIDSSVKIKLLAVFSDFINLETVILPEESIYYNNSDLHLEGAFFNCIKLKSISNTKDFSKPFSLPECPNVTNTYLSRTFAGCKELNGFIKMNSMYSSINNAFLDSAQGDNELYIIVPDTEDSNALKLVYQSGEDSNVFLITEDEYNNIIENE